MQENTRPISGVFQFVIVIYQLAWHIALPLVLFRLWWKARKEPRYIEHLGERLGFYPASNLKAPIWIHAVSVGETRAATPIIKALIEKGNSVLLTHTTPTGRQTGFELFKEFIHQGKLTQSYLPYDFCWPISRFFKHYKPQVGLMMETEVWPSVLFFSRNKFPIYLINGRLSPKSSRNFAKFGNLSKTLFGLFKGIFAQTQSDANEYIKFGVTNYVITGNLKFDAPIDPQQIETGLQWKAKFENRQIIVFASSREGEEELIIKAFLKLKNDKNPILILVPRHLTRMEGIEKFLVNQKITYIKRSTIHNLSEFNQDIIIGDTMGEMAMYLAMADYVIMGGTWMGTGGQNLIEPISLGKPVILGPSTFNFSDISQLAVRAGIAIQTKTQAVDELEEFLVLTMQGFLDFPQKLRDLETQCTEFSKLHQGATLKTLNNLII